MNMNINAAREQLKDLGPIPIPRMTREELKAFVLNYCDGKLTLSCNVPGDLLHMVFLPLVFGALDLPEDAREILGVRPGSGPDFPTPPADVSREGFIKSEFPPEAPEPNPKWAEIQAREEQIRADIEWEEADDKDLEVFLASDAYKTLAREYEAHVKAHVKALATWHEEFEAQSRAYQDAVREQGVQQIAYEAELRTYEAGLGTRQEEYDSLLYELRVRWTAPLGVIYEHNDQAGFRAINGYPQFFSLRMMHAEDWAIARAAVNRELDRRKADDPLDGLMPDNDTANDTEQP